jgi:hypothetical protein
MGVALSLLFLLWFLSGIVMMYWSFPSVSAKDRLERFPALNSASIKVTPLDAYRVLHSSREPSQVRLNSFDGRPVYRFRTGSDERLVYADTGLEPANVRPEMLCRIATDWAGPNAGQASEAPVTEPDQWTVQGQLRNLRPLWKYSFPDGQQVYVSGNSGEVVQYTTTRSRFWAYLGAIPHWLYFAPLRVHQKTWSNVVIWTSGIGTLATLLGIAIALWMYSPSKRYRNSGMPTGIPYQGQKRWHMIFGLLFGVLACTWAFSGMLSMNPFPTNTSAPAPPTDLARIPSALRGARFDLTAFSERHPSDALRAAADFATKELELATVAGEPTYIATSATGASLFIPLQGAPFTDFGQARVAEVIQRAASPTALDIRLLTEYDAYYLDRHREKPLPVLLITEQNSPDARYYVDPKTARVVGNYNSASWVNRWLYHGLHSLDFPWLYKYRPLWDIVVITLMLGCTALCVTSLILTWQVLQRKVATFVPGTTEEVIGTKP